MKTKSNTFKLVLTALMICLIIVMILFVRVPIPFTQGYVHLGDAMVFLAVLMLGWKYGALAAGLGGMLSDVIGGFAMWAPWTFVLKAGMALILGAAIHIVDKRPAISRKLFLAGEVIGMVIAGLFEVAGYYIAEGIMYGNWAAPLLGVPWNIGQFAVGMIIAVVLASMLCKTPAKQFFTYRMRAAVPMANPDGNPENAQ